MKAPVTRRFGSLLAAALVLTLGVATEGCKRAGETSDTGNTSGMSGPATAGGASSASGLTGPAVTPAPAPPRGTQ